MPPPEWTDQELVETLSGAGPLAAEAEQYLLFTLCHDALWFHSKGSEQEYDDLLGELYLHLRGTDDEKNGWTRLRSWNGDSSLKTWLGTVVRNLHLDRLRKLGRQSGRFRPIEEWDGVDAEDSMTSQEKTLDLAFTRSALLRAIEQLSDQEKLVVHLNCLEELPINEVADVMKIRDGHVRVIKHRAINELRLILEGAANDSKSR